MGEGGAAGREDGGGEFPSEIEIYYTKINKLALGFEPCLNQNNVSNQMLTVSIHSGFQTHYFTENGRGCNKGGWAEVAQLWPRG